MCRTARRRPEDGDFRTPMHDVLHLPTTTGRFLRLRPGPAVRTGTHRSAQQSAV
ncbi:hypothetical protein SNL152K_4787 [Streptomyces sp. NL15-2K]|nr:hypothetical protein SNL152K_4787 [Streptomyces sp. NL15-2K]